MLINKQLRHEGVLLAPVSSPGKKRGLTFSFSQVVELARSVILSQNRTSENHTGVTGQNIPPAGVYPGIL